MSSLRASGTAWFRTLEAPVLCTRNDAAVPMLANPALASADPAAVKLPQSALTGPTNVAALPLSASVWPQRVTAALGARPATAVRGRAGRVRRWPLRSTVSPSRVVDTYPRSSSWKWPVLVQRPLTSGHHSIGLASEAAADDHSLVERPVVKQQSVPVGGSGPSPPSPPAPVPVPLLSAPQLRTLESRWSRRHSAHDRIPRGPRHHRG